MFVLNVYLSGIGKVYVLYILYLVHCNFVVILDFFKDLVTKSLEKFLIGTGLVQVCKKRG